MLFMLLTLIVLDELRLCQKYLLTLNCIPSKIGMETLKRSSSV